MKRCRLTGPIRSRNTWVRYWIEESFLKLTLETATLLVVCLCGFVFQADLTALAAALPDLGTEFGTTSARAAWVIDVYSLASIFCLPIAGSLADKYGRVKIFTFGVSRFSTQCDYLCELGTQITFNIDGDWVVCQRRWLRSDQRAN